jgi:hypothetical protein
MRIAKVRRDNQISTSLVLDHIQIAVSLGIIRAMAIFVSSLVRNRLNIIV